MPKTMTCKYCGNKIIWQEGNAWLAPATSKSLIIQADCPGRPARNGGPSAGHDPKVG